MTDMLEVLPRLPDIDEVEPLSESDLSCMKALRGVLKEHGALSRFGITLLHSHFDVADDEVMMEFVNKENRTLTTRPVKAVDYPDGYSVETSWRLDSQTGVQRCEQQCAKPYGAKGPHVRQHFTVG
jgi:hypothetical protein